MTYYDDQEIILAQPWRLWCIGKLNPNTILIQLFKSEKVPTHVNRIRAVVILFNWSYDRQLIRFRQDVVINIKLFFILHNICTINSFLYADELGHICRWHLLKKLCDKREIAHGYHFSLSTKCLNVSNCMYCSSMYSVYPYSKASIVIVLCVEKSWLFLPSTSSRWQHPI